MKRNFKVPHSSDRTHNVYRRFHYTPKIRLDVITAVALALAFIGIYIIIPTPSDAVEVAALSGFFISIFDISFRVSLIYALVFYKAIGVALLVAGLLFGGIVVRTAIEKRVGDLVDKIKT
ncbi:MAG: hypothetical protein AABW84_00345 [Nanoarchaeota archaeon]